MSTPRPQEVVEMINLITRQRKLDRDFVVTALRDAIASTVRKNLGIKKQVLVHVDPKTGEITIQVEKTVVKEVQDPNNEISLEEARKINPMIEEGQTLMVDVPFDIFGRNAVFKIQNTFLQRIREAERQHIYRDFQQRIGEVIIGTVQKEEKAGVYVGLGKAEAFLPREECIPGERYRQGGTIRAMILRVEETGRRGRPQIILSRTHPDFLKRLMEIEIPEVTEGTVEIRSVARIPGKRAKVAVRSKDPRVDPVGACIGVRGTRIQPVSRELGGEKIDVVYWYPELPRFAASALSPVEPLLIYEDGDKLVAVIEDEKIPEAKGKEAQNVILASKLVGREIEIQPRSAFQGVPEGVSILELEGIPSEVIEAMRKRGMYVFKDVPSLAELVAIEGVDETLALKILEMIETKLEEKRRQRKVVKNA